MFGSSIFSSKPGQRTNSASRMDESSGGSYIPSASAAIGSLSRLSRRGMNNIHRVKKTGKEYANRLYSTRFTNYKDLTNVNSRNLPELDTKTTFNNESDDNSTKLMDSVNIDPFEKQNINYYNENESQMSLNSEATTLVNTPTSNGFFYNNKHNHKIDTIYNISPNSKRSSYNSRSSTRINRLDSVTPVIIEKKTDIIDIKDSIPFQDIKTKICSFGHEDADQLGKSKHLHYYQLPFPWRENRYIIYNYRFYDSHKKSLLSIFNWYGWHNETSNIWTHLLGAIYMAYLALIEFPNTEVYQSPNVPMIPKIITFVFLIASIKCLLASTFWHTFNGTSFLNLRRKFACVDYSGITILITATILTTEFVTLYNYKLHMCIYVTISLALGVLGVYLNCSPKFDSPESRPLRIKFFVLLAAMGILSFCHTTYLEGYKFAFSLLTPVTNKSIIWYCVGVLFYGSFIPERFRTDVKVDKSIPTQNELASDLDIITKYKDVHFREHPTCNGCSLKSFFTFWWVDYFGCSHTFWHFFVVLGVIGQYNAIIDIYTKRWLA